MSSVWRLNSILAMIIGSVLVSGSLPAQEAPAAGTASRAAAPLKKVQPAKKAQPGIGSWTQFRGDFACTGYSHSPSPKYRGIKWKYFMGGGVTSTPLLVNGCVIAATETGFIHAIDAATGDKKWNAVLGKGGVGEGVVHSSPLAFNGKLYFGSRPGKLYCLDGKNGETLWAKQLTRKSSRIAPAVPLYASPKGDERGIVMPSMSGEIWCVDPDTGETRWMVETSREMGGTAVIVGNMVYVATKGRRIFEIDYRDGKVLRTIHIPGTTHCSPAYGLGYLFLTIGDDKCIAVDLMPPAKGAPEVNPVLWTVSARGQARNAMTYRNSVVYIRDGVTMFAANAHTGQRHWSTDLTYKTIDPVLLSDQIILGSRDGVLKAVRTKDGEEVFSIDLGQKLHQGPIVVDGIIYQATIKNYVFAIE